VQLAHLQQTLQQPMQQPWRGFGTTELARLGDPFAAGYNTRSWQREVGRMKHYENPWEQRFAGGFWGTFDPRNYTPQKLYEGGKYAVQHPMDTLKTTFTTPEGLGGLTSGALVTAATGGAGSATLANRLSKAGKAGELADNVAQNARAANMVVRNTRGDFGIPGRQSMLDWASDQGYSLGAMLRGEQAPHYNPHLTSDGTIAQLRDAVANRRSQGGRLNDEGMRFDYTGNLRHVNSKQHDQFISDQMGELDDWLQQHDHTHPQFADRYDEYLDNSGLDPSTYDSGGTFEGFAEEPHHVTNVRDEHGNLVGSGTHHYEIGGLGKHNIFHGGEAYIRPEFRDQMGPFQELLKPAMELPPNWKVDATIANDKLAKLALAAERRGRIKLTDETRMRATHRDPTRQGTPMANGLYPYENALYSLPRLLGSGPLSRLFSSERLWSGG